MTDLTTTPSGNLLLFRQQIGPLCDSYLPIILYFSPSCAALDLNLSVARGDFVCMGIVSSAKFFN